MNSNRGNLTHIQKPLICIYTNQNRNEFAIGLEKDEIFMAVTKVGESYTRFVDAYDQISDEKEINWKLELKRWIAATKKNESIFVEVDLCLESKRRRILQIFLVYFLLEGTKEKLVE